MKCVPWCVLISFLGVVSNVSAQSDSSFIFTAYQNAIKHYSPNSEYQWVLYNGSLYKEPEQTDDGHPFYLTDDWQSGTIFYDGARFDNIDMLYDIYSDILAIEHKNGTAMALVKPKVSEFIISGRRFINVVRTDSMNALPKNGYYQLVYNGRTTCLSRWYKHRTQSVSQGEVEIFYTDKRAYYVLKNGVFHDIRSRASVMKLLRDQKQKVRRYIASEQIDFSDDRESALNKILAYYDTLVTQ